MEPTYVLVPGMDGTGRLFAGLTAALGDAAASIVTYPHDRGVEAAELARAIAPPPGPYVLVAESYGGPVAMRFASTRPPGLVGLVLVATFATTPVRGALRPLAGLARAPLFRVPPPGFALRALLLGSDAPEALVTETAAAIASVAPAVMAARVHELATLDLRDRLASIAVPTLVVHARRDRLVPRALADELVSLLGRHVPMETLEIDAAHLVLQREPAQCAAAIRAFGRARTRD